MKTVLHILNTNSYSGAENVAITLIRAMNRLYPGYRLIYVSPDGPISERLARLENAVELFTADITTLEESLGTEAQVRANARTQKKILLAQIEMLKEVFICSALPQYQKDAISEKVKLMKEELEVYEESGE